MIGQRVGPYQITSKLGAGGMGEVYRARDTKLNRDVAIKMLPEAFARDAERLARFTREAQTLAALNHPNIAQIYGVVEGPAGAGLEGGSGLHALVMELVEGEDLSQRIARGAIPVSEALSIAYQIADAVEAAHEKGIVHRDLKPANVKITPDGKVKVLDFGLAKAVETNVASSTNLANSPTLTAHATQAGLILGTAAYMSPEQARGLPADHRSDVFSFGVVLYEMLTRRAPFQGDTVSDVLASVLAREPDLTALPGGINPRLPELLRRCLDKSPKRRWQAIGDVRAEIETIAAAPLAAPAAVFVAAAPPRPLWKRLAPVVVCAVLASAITGMVVRSVRPQVAPAVTRFTITLSADQGVLAGRRDTGLAVSPDGRHIAFSANQQLYLRDLAALDAVPIAGTFDPASPASPVFSPDGGSLAYHSITDNALRRIPAGGGTPVKICDTEAPRGLSWEGDSLLFGAAAGVMRVSASGGTPETLFRVGDNEVVYGPQLLPDGKALLFSVAPLVSDDRWAQGKVVVQSLGSAERSVVVPTGASGARYLPSGHVVYALNGVVFAVPFDLKTRTVRGAAVAVVEGVRRSVGMSGGLDLVVSDTGTLVFVTGPVSPSASKTNLGLFDRSGGAEPLEMPPGNYAQPRLSPDGKRIAYSKGEGRDAAIWVVDLSGASSARQLTFEGRNRFPIWSSDSTRVAFQSDREGDLGIFWQRADGSGTAERLTRAEKDTAHVPQSWSPDGAHLLYDVVTGSAGSLWTLSLREKTSGPFADVSSAASTGATFSPDGRWVTYSARVGEITGVYVQPFPPTGTKYMISKASENAHHPVWSRDGRELFYTPGPGNRLNRVGVTTTKTSFQFAEAAAVVRRFENLPPVAERPYDVTRDGRFLALIDSFDATATGANRARINVVLNWFEELRSRVPLK